MQKKTINIGKIYKPYGIFGWVHIISYTDLKKNIFNYFPWKLQNSKNKLYKNDIIKWKKYKENFIVLIKGIYNRTNTIKIIKKKITIKSTQLPILKSNEYYWNNILSCLVYNIQNKFLGYVIKILENNFYDILVIQKKNAIKKKIIYIPFVEPKIIKIVNIIKKKIIVDWIF